MASSMTSETSVSSRTSEILALKMLEKFKTQEMHIWHGPSANAFKLIKGPQTVKYIPNFITEEEENFLMSQIYSAPKRKWFCLSNRRLQNYGGLITNDFLIPEEDFPPWLDYFINKIMTLDGCFPKENRPNHVLINEYKVGQGIMGHTDGPVFYPLVATISLGSDTMLDYYREMEKEEIHMEFLTRKTVTKEERHSGSVLLERRSLHCVTENAYSKYLHEITERTEDFVTDTVLNIGLTDKKIGDIIQRGERLSLTIRNVPKVCKMSIHDFLRKRL